MIKQKQARQIIEYLEYFLTFINILIALRLLILSISLDNFRNAVTGKLTEIGNNIKFTQMIAEGITNPIIKPFKNILISLTKMEDVEFINILSPAFTIIALFVIMALLKLLTPSIIRYIDKMNRN